jgi:hypothetical protein
MRWVIAHQRIPGNRPVQDCIKTNMRRNHFAKLLLVGAIAVTTVFVSAGTALGCSCMEPDADTLFADADGAFVGRLVQGDPNSGGGMNQVPFTFEVLSAHKGEIENPVVVFTADSSATCGLAMAEGSEASLFVYRAGDTWEGNLCATMGPEALAGFPEVAVTEGEADDTTGMARWALAALVVGGVGAVVITRFRQRGLLEPEE